MKAHLKWTCPLTNSNLNSMTDLQQGLSERERTTGAFQVVGSDYTAVVEREPAWLKACDVSDPLSGTA